mmetsp:Transcript_34233/g.79645  ORF Transcript_34233/g.79645 Transcript_34233/m.79645 type:complete len:211 (-) Transcript_34233:26-658(-)
MWPLRQHRSAPAAHRHAGFLPSAPEAVQPGATSLARSSQTATAPAELSAAPRVPLSRYWQAQLTASPHGSPAEFSQHELAAPTFELPAALGQAAAWLLRCAAKGSQPLPPNSRFRAPAPEELLSWLAERPAPHRVRGQPHATVGPTPPHPPAARRCPSSRVARAPLHPPTGQPRCGAWLRTSLCRRPEEQCLGQDCPRASWPKQPAMLEG